MPPQPLSPDDLRAVVAFLEAGGDHPSPGGPATPSTVALGGHDRGGVAVTAVAPRARSDRGTDADVAARASEQAVGERVAAHWPERTGLWGFLTSVDHKRIGHRYMVTAALYFSLAGIEALIMRTQLARPEETLLSPEEYNQLFTVHGTVMIFFFSTPMLFGFGNFLFPLMLGTRDMAFPRLNAFGYWVFAAAGAIMFGSLVFQVAPDGGWFAYVPLTGDRYSPGVNLDIYCLGLLFLGVSTTAGAINFLVTALKLRAPGMTISRTPVFVWAVVVTSFMVLFALPALNADNAMLFFDRRFGTHFFQPSAGGDAVLWQHLFWIFGHPDVYIIVLPALGIISSIVPTFSRRPIAGYHLIVLASVATAIISFGVWVHHMFAVGLPQLALSFFSAASVVVTIPAGVQMFSWLTTMLQGRLVLRVPMLWAMGFIVAFVLGGVTGVMFALVAFDQQVTDSLLRGRALPLRALRRRGVPDHRRTLLLVAEVHGPHAERARRPVGFWLTFAGFNLTFFPMHISGLLGMPRRIYTFEPGLGWDPYNLAATIGRLRARGRAAHHARRARVRLAARAQGGAGPLGRGEPGVGDDVAAGDAQLRRHPHRAQPAPAVGSGQHRLVPARCHRRRPRARPGA